jgi:pimeloyl-ACP methyl ester carboxylesterase
MPAVFVHGVPDTAACWDPLLGALTRDDTATLALPGFGTPVPDGFGATKDEYAAWVIDELEAFGEPVDLVGHDWGSLLVQRVALTRPDLLRTFVMSDAAVTSAFTWHDLATQWQTPELGEQIMELMTPDAVAAALADAGHPDAATAAAAVDDTMKRCILSLYRSATAIADEWSPSGPAARPGLVLWGASDPFGPVTSGERFSAAADVPLVVLEGGHWAPMQHAREAADAIEAFWAEPG